MRLLTGVFLVIFFHFGINANKHNQLKTRYSDTAFFKKVNYLKLNKLVSYHIIKNGKIVSKLDLLYTIQPIAVYNYYYHRYDVAKNEKPIHAKPKDMERFILSNRFSNREGFNGLFKINSKIEVIYKPFLLKKLTVFPISNDAKNINLLINKLKRESFVNNLVLDTLKPTSIDTLFHSLKKNIVIRIKLKPEYWSIEKIRGITEQLNKWPDIDKKMSMSVVDLFTGYSEQDMIFRITSEKPKLK